jgi:hypothetical protein
VHQSIRQEIESSILETMKTAVQVLAAQETPASFSCSLQAKFLSNALREYDKARRCQSVGKTQNEHVAEVTQPKPNLTDVNTSSSTASHRQSSTLFGGDSSVQAEGHALNVNTIHDSSMDTLQAGPNEQIYPMNISSGNIPEIGTWHSNQDTKVLETVESQAADWTFGNDDIWSAMFLNAGFDIGEGIFLPDSSA